jgi:hypothetical protein
MTNSPNIKSQPNLRFVLGDGSDREELLETGLAKAAAAVGGTISGGQVSRDAPGYRRRTWRISPSDVVIELVDDAEIETLWINICGSAAALVNLQVALAEHVPWVIHDRLVSEARSLSPRAIARLALGTNAVWDPEVAELLDTALMQPDTDTRARAIEAMYVLHWRQFIPAVQQAISTEQDKGVRAMLDQFLQVHAPRA